MSNERKCAVITGRNYCNILTMVRALGRSGYDVEVLRVFKSKPSGLNLLRKMKPECYSKYVNKYEECIANDNPQNVIDHLLRMSDSQEKKLLIPVDDYLACTVDEALDVLKTKYIVPSVGNMQGEISRLMDKNEQKKLASDFNLPVLNSVLIKSENGCFTIPDEINYPCFIKPNVSMKSTKAKMSKCDDRESLERILGRYAAAGDFEILVEDFADIKHEYSILGVATPDGITAPGLFRVIDGGHRERKGVAVTGELISCDTCADLIKQCEGFIGSLDYTGMFDIDLIETKDGHIYFVELNFRAGASMHVLTEVGINLAGMYADNLMKGVPIDENCRTECTGKRFVSEKVLMEEYVRSDVSGGQVKEMTSASDVFFIKDEDDPQPYKYFKKFYLAAFFMRVPYKMRDHIKK